MKFVRIDPPGQWCTHRAVQDAIDKLEQFRNELFQSMFGSKSKD